MRINVYSQELTKEVKLVHKTTEDGLVYHGIRMYFASSPLLHNTDGDDDRSAITFWLPYCKSMTPADLAQVFVSAAELIVGMEG